MNLESKIAKRAQEEESWQVPVHYKLDGRDNDQFEELIDKNQSLRVIDPVEDIAEDLYDVRRAHDEEFDMSPQDFRESVLDQGLGYGEWVHLPWNNAVVRYPERDDHRDLRTFRNEALVTRDEQLALYDKTISVTGLSVGSNVADVLLRSGIGNRFVIADYDRVSPSNLNRIQAHLGHVGMSKIDVMARKISEIDPYIEQIHIPEGYSDEAEAILDAVDPDLLIEEIDNPQAKARFRRYAMRANKPVLMGGDIAETATLLVERHDLGEVEPFAGKISRERYEGLLDGGLSPKDAVAADIGIAGPGAIFKSARFIESHMKMKEGKLGGIPQLGMIAMATAVLTSTAAKEVLLGRPMDSGRYTMSPSEAAKVKRRVSIPDHVRTVNNLRKSLGK